nr:uncharacterized protein LOC128686083 [Cherax quadricarinatus]
MKRNIMFLWFVFFGVFVCSVGSQESTSTVQYPKDPSTTKDPEPSSKLRSSGDEVTEPISHMTSGVVCTTPSPSNVSDLVALPRPVVSAALILILTTAFLHIIFIVHCCVSAWSICSSKIGKIPAHKVSDFGLRSRKNSHSPSPENVQLRRRVKNLPVHFDYDSREEPRRRSIATTPNLEGFFNLDRVLNQGKYSKNFSLCQAQTSPVMEREDCSSLSYLQETRNDNDLLRHSGEHNSKKSYSVLPLPTITVEAPRECEDARYPNSGPSSDSITRDKWLKSLTSRNEGILLDELVAQGNNYSLLARENARVQTQENASNSDNERYSRDPRSDEVDVDIIEKGGLLTNAKMRTTLVPHFRASSISPVEQQDNYNFRESFCYVATDPEFRHSTEFTSAPGYHRENLRSGETSKFPYAPPSLQLPKCNNKVEQEIKLPFNIETQNIFDSDPEPDVLEAWNIPVFSKEKKTATINPNPILLRKSFSRNTLGVSEPQLCNPLRRFSSFEVIEAQRRNPTVKEHHRSFHGGDNIASLLQGYTELRTLV